MSSETGRVLYQDPYLKVDAAGGAVWLEGRLLPLTRKELQLLLMLVRNAGEVVRREVLLTEVWGYQAGVKSRTLDVHVRRLRRHLGVLGNLYVETIFSKGYRFQPIGQMDIEKQNGLRMFRLRLRMAPQSATRVI